MQDSPVVEVVQTLQNLHNVGHHVILRVTEPEKEWENGIEHRGRAYMRICMFSFPERMIIDYWRSEVELKHYQSLLLQYKLHTVLESK